ncbi:MULTISPECIES: ABC transporter permease [unclassified Prochlorococcus]|uniref:ABC transporter permease n=1 Tax=unclassified Prochlorococcus TaxID=2627481 RepID=UPI00055EA7C3|nr:MULTISPECIES: ABC-2 family transporter protein [unclassified Prochlorococcus]
MGRYLLSLQRFWATALAGQLEYQANMLIDLLAMVGSLAGSIFVLSLFFGQGRELGGWSWEAALVVQGIYTFLDGVSSTWLRPNLSAIVTHVREGTLDFVLLKPIDSQFWVSLRIMAPAGLPEMGLGLVLIVWAASRAGASFSLGTLLVAVLMLCVGGVILYALWFVIAATSIWFVKTWNATEVLRAVLASGRFPVSAYPPTLRLVFTLVLPVAFLTTVPAEVILGRAAMQMLVLGLFLAVIFFVGSRAFWLFALRYYTSASS